MRRRLIICAIAAACSYSASAHAIEQPMCQRLVAANYIAQPQDAAQQDDAQRIALRQLSTEFVQRLARVAQVQIKQVAAQGDQALAEVHSGRVDLIIGIEQSVEQGAQLDYLLPAYTQLRYGLWVRSGEHRTLKQWPELLGIRGTRVVPPQRLIDFDLQAQLLNWPVRTAAAVPLAVDQVLAGEADYIVAQEQIMRTYLHKHDLQRRFELMEQPVAVEGLYMAISKDSACNSPALRARLSKALSSLSSQ